ncbi:MAG: M64 family metallopeptidase [Acidobacteriota bacterium]
MFATPHRVSLFIVFVLLFLGLGPLPVFASEIGYPQRGPAPIAAAPSPGATEPAAGPTTPAHYLIVQAGEALAPRVTFYRQVEIQGSLESLNDPQVQELASTLSTRQDQAVELRLRDTKGQVVYRGVQRVPRWHRSETLLDEDDPRVKEHGTRLAGHHLPVEEAPFVVRVPVIPGASQLEIDSGVGLLRTATTFDLDSLAAQFAHTDQNTTEAIAGAFHEAVPGFYQGNSNNRVDILIVAEGYRHIDDHWFRTDSDAMVAGFMGDRPFTDYSTHFNVWRLFVPSIAMGADRPACDDADAGDLDTGFTANTYFDATYCNQGIWRNLGVNNSKVFEAASDYPDWDAIIVLVQSPYRGGSGGALSVTSMDTSYTASDDIIGVMQHEFAHSFAGLGDEYETADEDFPECSDRNVSTSDDCEPNVTDVDFRSGNKWKHWIASSTPVPTSGSLSDPLAAGAWEGARYLTDDIYRSCFNGIMRDSLADFCHVGRERMIVSLYQGGWGIPGGGVSTIQPGTRSPSAALLNRSAGQKTTFSARAFGPPGTTLTAQWLVNGIVFKTQSVASGGLASYSFSSILPGSTWNIQLRITDNHPNLHSSTRPQLAKSQHWTVNIIGGGGGCPLCLLDEKRGVMGE